MSAEIVNGRHPGEPHREGLAQRLNWLRAGVLGANDGIVSVAAVVVGVAGATPSVPAILTAGLAALVGGAISMALGEYTSVGTQNAAVHAEVAVERAEMETNLPAEKAELVQMYRDMGLTEETARRVTEEIHANQELAVRVHLTQELGIDPNEQPSPIVAALSSFLAFAVGAVIPLLPFFAGVHILWVGLGVGAVGLFVAGAVVARFTRRSWWWNGIRQLIFGALAAAASYGVGALIGVSAVG